MVGNDVGMGCRYPRFRKDSVGIDGCAAAQPLPCAAAQPLPCVEIVYFKVTRPRLSTEGEEEGGKDWKRGGGSANKRMIAWSSSSGVPSAGMLPVLSLLQGVMQQW